MTILVVAHCPRASLHKLIVWALSAPVVPLGSCECARVCCGGWPRVTAAWTQMSFFTTDLTDTTKLKQKSNFCLIERKMKPYSSTLSVNTP